MDIFKEDFRGNYRFRNIGAFCPKCYAFTEVGDVNVKVHADFSEGFSPEQFEVEPVSLMTYPQKCTGFQRSGYPSSYHDPVPRLQVSNDYRRCGDASAKSSV